MIIFTSINNNLVISIESLPVVSRRLSSLLCFSRHISALSWSSRKPEIHFRNFFQTKRPDRGARRPSLSGSIRSRLWRQDCNTESRSRSRRCRRTSPRWSSKAWKASSALCRLFSESSVDKKSFFFKRHNLVTFRFPDFTLTIFKLIYAINICIIYVDFNFNIKIKVITFLLILLSILKLK